MVRSLLHNTVLPDFHACIAVFEKCNKAVASLVRDEKKTVTIQRKEQGTRKKTTTGDNDRDSNWGKDRDRN